MTLLLMIYNILNLNAMDIRLPTGVQKFIGIILNDADFFVKSSVLERKNIRLFFLFIGLLFLESCIVLSNRPFFYVEMFETSE